MRLVRCAAGLAAVLAGGGCANRFRPPANDHPAAIQASHGAPDRLLVSALPADLSWLADGLKLYRDIGRNAAPADAAPTDWMSVLPSASRSPAVSADASEAPADDAAPATADLRFVSVPLRGDAARGLALVPADLEAAVAPAILPPALQAARSASGTVALPIAARWMALAYDPAHLDETPSPVPPNLEAWVEQLRALRRRRPEHPPLIAAWNESRIAGSFALLLAANGGRLLDDGGQPAFSSPEGVATVELMARMLADGLVQPTALATDSHRLAAALSGPYAYWLCPSETLEDSDRPRPDRLAALRVSGLPVAAGRYHYPESVSVALVQFRGVAVTASSPRASAAWRLARFLADPVVLRSTPPATTVLAAPPPAQSTLVRQARALIAGEAITPWPDRPGMNEVLGKFLQAALRRTLTPREALERAALQIARPGELPAETTGSGGASPTGNPTGQEHGPRAPEAAGSGGQPGDTAGSELGATSESTAAATARAHQASPPPAATSPAPALPGLGSGPGRSDTSRSADFGPSASTPAARP